jgi:hypothetical protein
LNHTFLQLVDYSPFTKISDIMKKLLLLLFLLFAALQNYADCEVQPSFTYTVDGNTATFTNTSTVGAGYSINNFYWEFSSGVYNYDPYPVHTFDVGICENGNAILYLEIDYLGSYCGSTGISNVVVLITNPIQIILNDEIDSILQTVTVSPVISGGTAPYTYIWNYQSQIYNTAVFTFPNVQDYYYLPVSCYVVDSNGCEAGNSYYIENPFFNCTLELNLTVDENLIVAQPIFNVQDVLGEEWGGYFQVLGGDSSDYFYNGSNAEYSTFVEDIGDYEMCFYLDEYSTYQLPQCPTQACQTFEVTSIDQNCNALIGFSISNENDVYFTNYSTGYYNQLLWNFGDGETSVLGDPSHSFDPGNHTVILNVSNTETLCASSDTVTFYINEPAHICGYVFMDENANGIFDTDEVLADSITLYTFNNEFITSSQDGFAADIQSGISCLYLLLYNLEFIITTPVLDEYCEGGILINLEPGEELCPLAIGISIPKTTICGTMYFDTDNNGFYDIGESPLAYQNIYAQIFPFGNSIVVTDTNGFYCIEVPVGGQVYLNPDFSFNPFANIQPSEFNNFIYDQSPIIANFGVYYVENALDLGVDLVNSGNCVAGFDQYYNLYASNYSNLSSTAIITFQYNNQKTYNYSNPEGTNNDLDNLVSWNVTMEPFSQQYFSISVLNSADMTLGNEIIVSATIEATGGDPDFFTANDNSMVYETVVGSFDPNNKLVVPAGDGENGAIPYGSFGELQGFEELTYTINFQNTGTAPAVNVVVTDEIDSDLDVTTIHLIGTTHNAQMIVNGNNVVWTFNNIQLPDSNTNEPESHGSITYRISIAEGIYEGTEITNTANIYFDFNEAIVTNTVLNTLYYPLDLNESVQNDLVLIYPNPVSDFVSLEVSKESDINIYDIQGRFIKSFQKVNGLKVVDISNFSSGVYFISFINSQNSTYYSLLKK